MLTVLSVAFPFAPVHPEPVGGAEHVLGCVDARLVRDGHRSIVLAAAGSRTAGEAVEIPAPAKSKIDRDAWIFAHETYRRELARLLRENAIDVVHFHGVDFIDYVPETDVPIVATLHVPRAWYKPHALTSPRIERVCVSRAQRATFLPDVDSSDVIENGVALDRYAPAASKGDFALALGRICPEKGFEHAIFAARRARVPLVVAGAVFPYEEHERYARDVLAPMLDGDRRLIGPIGGERKRTLLAEARCLITTSLVQETSSIVAMEALASGTPVVGFVRGALPEIVEQGVTGFLVRDPDELPDAIERAKRLDPRACRAAAERRFSADVMTERYIALHRSCARTARSSTPAMDVHVARTDDELVALEREWDALCDRCPIATPFQRPGWLLAWRRAFGRGGEPRVAILRRAGRLCGIVPLELRDGALRFIGEGITDYLDAIVEHDLDATVLASAVQRAASGAREIQLSALRPCSPLLAISRAIDATTEAGEPSPVLAMDKVRPPKRFAKEMRRLERAGARWVNERGDWLALLEGLFALHRARWTARGERGVLDAPGLKAFHREAAASFKRKGILRLVGLVMSDRLVAVQYAFSDHRRFSFYLSGFTPEAAYYSPGRMLVARSLDRAREDDALELDFLRGREPYKYEWGAVDRPASILRAPVVTDLAQPRPAARPNRSPAP